VAPTPNGDTAIVSSPTYNAGFVFRVPILDGGRRASERAEVESQIRQASIKRQVGQRQIELQVRLAFESLEGAARGVDLAGEQSSLASEDSDATRARYAAGEASGIDVAEAQARLFRARHDYTLALYQHEMARIALAEATGDIVGMKW
jgi:outer membrane protein TolC